MLAARKWVNVSMTSVPALPLSMCSDCHNNESVSLALWSSCMFSTLESEV